MLYSDLMYIYDVWVKLFELTKGELPEFENLPVVKRVCLPFISVLINLVENNSAINILNVKQHVTSIKSQRVRGADLVSARGGGGGGAG